jgi:PmbA protein
MIEKALEAAKKRAQAVEISIASSHSANAEYEDDKLKQVAISQSTHVGVRVIVDGKLGSAHGTDPNAAEAIAARAVELAEFGAEVNFDFPGTSQVAEVAVYEPEVEKTTAEELVATGAGMLEAVKKYSDEVKVSAGAGWSVTENRLINSSGLDVSRKGSHYGIGVGGTRVRGTDMLFVYQGQGWRTKKLSPEKLTQLTIEQLRLAETIASLESKAMPIIFTPRGNYILLMALLIGINGKNVLKGDSPLAGRLGERIASPGLTITDDPTVAFAPASGAYDGEGVPTQKRDIVKDGILQTFLYDLETAAKAGVQSTGSGPGCGTSNVIIAPGDATLEQMIKDTKEGLLIDHVIGMGQSNIINGDFSVNISLGYKIENGEIVGRVKDAMLAGNDYDAMMKIEAIGSEPEWQGSFCAPPIKVGGLSVVAK